MCKFWHWYSPCATTLLRMYLPFQACPCSLIWNFGSWQFLSSNRDSEILLTVWIIWDPTNTTLLIQLELLWNWWTAFEQISTALACKPLYLFMKLTIFYGYIRHITKLRHRHFVGVKQSSPILHRGNSNRFSCDGETLLGLPNRRGRHWNIFLFSSNYPHTNSKSCNRTLSPLGQTFCT